MSEFQLIVHKIDSSVGSAWIFHLKKFLHTRNNVFSVFLNHIRINKIHTGPIFKIQGVFCNRKSNHSKSRTPIHSILKQFSSEEREKKDRNNLMHFKSIPFLLICHIEIKKRKNFLWLEVIESIYERSGWKYEVKNWLQTIIHG